MYGGEFQLETDHKPLEFIFAPRSKPSARVERWVLRLQAFSLKVVYWPGRTNIADCLSRLRNRQTSPATSDGTVDIVHAIVESSVPVSITPLEIEQLSAAKEELASI